MADRGRDAFPVPAPSKRSNAPVGLDIDGRFLAAVQVDGHSVGRLVSHELPPGVTEDGEVRDDAALTEALKDMFKTHDLPSASASASRTPRSWSATSRCR